MHRDIPTIEIARSIDLTNLALDMTMVEVEELCAKALENHCASVCIPPEWVPAAVELLRGSGVKVCAVVSPHGGRDSVLDKIAETRRCSETGATEIDWVFDHEAVLRGAGRGTWGVVPLEVHALATLAEELKHIVFKAVVEARALGVSQKRWMCELLAHTGGIHFIKTSVGHESSRSGGVTVEDVLLFRRIIGEYGSSMQVDASGGITTPDQARALMNAGATRLGIGHVNAINILTADHTHAEGDA